VHQALLDLVPVNAYNKVSGIDLIKENRLKMGEIAHKTAIQHSWDRVAYEMEDIYLIERDL